jgi:hypothetical protein
LESPRNATSAPKHTLATVLGDMPDKVTWSTEELRFFAQHREGLGIGQEDYGGLPASYSFPNNSKLPDSSLKHRSSGDHDSTMKPAKISRIGAANGTLEERRLSRSYYSHSFSGHPYSMNVAAVKVPYEPKALWNMATTTYKDGRKLSS